MFLAPLILLASASQPTACDAYAGRYERPNGEVIVVACVAGELTVRPAFWRSVQRLTRTGDDAFAVVDRAERTVTFRRDGRGGVAELQTAGIGNDLAARRRVTSDPAAAELLMSNDGRRAARVLVKEVRDPVANGIALADFIVDYVPTRFGSAADFLDELRRLSPPGAALEAAAGDAFVAASRRDAARVAYAAALKLDAANERALAGSRMLAGVAATGGWSLPFSLDELFAPPTEEELAEVTRRWSARDLRPRDVEVVAKSTMQIDGVTSDVRLIAHRVHGSKHYGAVIVPRGAAPGSCGVIVEAKGVSPSYFPLDLDQPPYAAAVMGERSRSFIYVLPAYRGETIVLGGSRYTSEGDRTDVWDGATDDFLAVLHAALKVTPEADPSRVAFGKSRGGTVALLAGIREPAIRCVVSWSGPTDHFGGMVQSGWTPRERLVEGLRVQSQPAQIAGQFIETFLRHAIAGTETVRDVRLRLIASSPAWFASRLPPTQAHYGKDDNIVSIRNGELLARAARAGRLELVLHDEAGHDLNRQLAFTKTREFFLRHMAR